MKIFIVNHCNSPEVFLMFETTFRLGPGEYFLKVTKRSKFLSLQHEMFHQSFISVSQLARSDSFEIIRLKDCIDLFRSPSNARMYSGHLKMYSDCAEMCIQTVGNSALFGVRKVLIWGMSLQ